MPERDGTIPFEFALFEKIQTATEASPSIIGLLLFYKLNWLTHLGGNQSEGAPGTTDIGGMSDSAPSSVVVESPDQTIENRLIPGTYADCARDNILDGECGSMVVKLEAADYAYLNDRISTPLILGAYLNEFDAIVPDASVSPCFLIATNLRDALILNGLVPPPD